MALQHPSWYSGPGLWVRAIGVGLALSRARRGGVVGPDDAGDLAPLFRKKEAQVVTLPGLFAPVGRVPSLLEAALRGIPNAALRAEALALSSLTFRGT